MKFKFNSDIVYIAVLTFIVIAFFFRLFFPHIQTFITPDLALSDQLNFNYSLKNILSESLHKNQLPWWDSRIAGGFPLIGESQIGAFHLVNLITFKLLPFELAFNFGYVIMFLTSAIGSYYYFKLFSTDKLYIFFASVFFTFSATMFLQITHYNLLQTYSLIPWIFFCIEKILRKQNSKLMFFSLVFLLTQQFFAGYLMSVFMTLLTGFVYITIKYFLFKSVKKNLKLKNVFLLTILLSLILFATTSIQLVPMIEFAIQLTRGNGMGINSIANSLPFVALKTYVDFFSFGSPSLGTYSAQTLISLRNTIWDSNIYFGFLPFILIIATIIFLRNKKIQFFLVIALICLLFALGRYSPIYFIYSFPIFNFFRTPVRFTILLNFFLIAMLPQGLSFLDKKFSRNFLRILVIVGLIISSVLLLKIGYDYHPVVRSPEMISGNKMASFLNKYDKNRLNSNQFKIYQAGNEDIWYASMIQGGWKNIDKYIFFQNDLSVFLNTFYNFSSGNLFFGSYYYPQIDFNYDDLMKKEFYKMIRQVNQFANISFFDMIDYKFLSNYFAQKHEMSLTLIRLLQLKNIKYFISPIKLTESKYIKKIHEVVGQYEIPYYIRLYEVVNPKPRFYLTDSYHTIYNDRDIVNFLNTQDLTGDYFFINNKYTSMLSNETAKSKLSYSLKIEEVNKRSLKLGTIANQGTYLINTDSYYPGWKAYVDQKLVDIIPVNINQQAIKIPEGRHTIEFKYTPAWYLPVMIISLISNLVIISYIGLHILQLFVSRYSSSHTK